MQDLIVPEDQNMKFPTVNVGHEWNDVTYLLSAGPTLENSVLRIVYKVFSSDLSLFVKNMCNKKVECFSWGFIDN